MFTQAELQRLRAVLNTIQPAPSKSRKARRAKPLVQQQIALQPQNRRSVRPRRRKRGTGSLATNEGAVRITRTELFAEIKTDAGKMDVNKAIAIKPSSTCMPWLNVLGASFDRIVWHSATFHYRPYTSSMNSGALCMGVDWNFTFTTGALTKANVQSCTPCRETSCYTGVVMPLPSTKLMSRTSYGTANTGSDGGPGMLLITASTDKANLYFGDIWITYDITYSGTQA